MKLISLLFAATLALSYADDTQTRSLQSLAQKWNISDPSFDYDSLSFDMDYDVSDFISNDLVSYEIYDEDCKDGLYMIYSGNSTVGNVNLNAGIDSGISVEVTSPPGSDGKGTGALTRTYELNITLDPNKITADTNIYKEKDTDGTGQVTATISFCVRFSLSTKYGSSPIEVNFLETIVILIVDLTDGFSIGQVSVTPKERLVKTANQAYQVAACQCDPSSECYTDSNKPNFKQGSIVKICVQPDDDAQDDGILMRRIESFYFYRDYTNPTERVTQNAIVDGEVAGNLLTTQSCLPGFVVCSFESLLFADFYRNTGAVSGSGIASMQFGGGSGNRRLRSEGRNLQEEDEDAGASEFELNFGVESTDVESTSDASRMGVVAIAATFLSGLVALL